MGLLMNPSNNPSLTKLGGTPTGVTSFDWPICRSCKGAMRFIAQLRLADSEDSSLGTSPGVLLLFCCENAPGMCDEWDANSGGNAALVVPAGSDSISIPESGETLLEIETFITLVPYDSNVAQETEDDNYVAALDSEQEVLGKVGGSPLWLQDDETPDCRCGRAMQFIAMLEERGGILFGGGGLGYAFVCAHCRDAAKFLWQC